jgi:hypothetical protein
VYLIDDALAAVDAMVAQQLFDRVYMGMLKEKTRIVVMHQLQVRSLKLIHAVYTQFIHRLTLVYT